MKLHLTQQKAVIMTEKAKPAKTTSTEKLSMHLYGVPDAIEAPERHVEPVQQAEEMF